MPVLITDFTWVSVLPIIRDIAKKETRLFGCDSVKNRTSIRSRYLKDVDFYDLSKSESMLEELNRLIDEKKIDVILPVGQNFTLFMANNQRSLKEVSLPIPKLGSIERAHDKYLTITDAKKVGIEIPKSVPCDDPNTLYESADEIGYPIIVKPRKTEGTARGVKILNNKEEIQAYTKRSDGEQLLVQEYIPGDSSCMEMGNFLYDLSGCPIVRSSARKIREYPISGGITTCGVTTYNKELIEQCERLLTRWKWVGLAEVEFKRDPRDGKLKLIEVNPRMWQYSRLSIQAGITLGELWLKAARGEKVSPVTEYKTGVVFNNWSKDLLSLLHHRKKDDTYPFMDKIVKDVMPEIVGFRVFNDPLPFLKKARIW